MKPLRFTLSTAALALLPLPMAWAQDASRPISITPRVSVTETLTNNVALSNSAGARSDLVTEISPGIRVNIQGARLKTYFDYALSHVDYARGNSSSRQQNALNTFGTFEAVDNWAFIDFSGNISQQTISAFDTQSTNNTAVNANQTEVANYRVSPYVKGQLGNVANYEARVSRSVTSADNATASDTASTNSVVRVSNVSSFRRLGWSADVSRLQSSYSAGRTTTADNYSLGLTYDLSPQVKLSANAGQESNNYTSLDKQTYSTHSLGLTWLPSGRTKLSLLTGQRSFGNNHNVSFEHRSARTVWRFTDSKDVSTPGSQSGFGTVGNVYDLLFSQFATLEPDLSARAALVSSFLANRGISPSATVLGNFLTSAASVQRSQNLSFALLGIRDTITFLLTRTESSRLDTIASVVDNLSNANTVIQNGFSINYSHRLTPDYSLGVVLSHRASEGSTAAEATTLKSINVNLTGKLGQKTAASLGLRHVVSDSSNAYTETAVTGNLNVQF